MDKKDGIAEMEKLFNFRPVFFCPILLFCKIPQLYFPYLLNSCSFCAIIAKMKHSGGTL